MTSAPEAYVSQLLADYLSLPFVAPHRIARSERLFANQLYQRGIPLSTLRLAMLLAAYRRSTASHPPVRSLAYFRPILEEILAHPPPSDFFHFLAHRLAASVHFEFFSDDR